MASIEIKFVNLELSACNPRFTFLENIDSDIIEFIKKGNKNYSEEDVALTLLKNEGNLQDMLNLINSIVNSGWIDLGEQLIAIKLYSEKYVIAEGNRRLLALKLLFGNIKLPEKKELIEYSDNQNMYLDEELMGKIDINTNYKKIKEIIKNYNHNSDSILKKKTLKVNIVDKSADLWTLLYTKHISGERPGMRQWKRGKYFVDILNFFPYGIDRNDKDLSKKVSIKLRRDISAIFRDFIQAQFIRDMFEVANKDIEQTKQDIKNSNVSALETTYSIKHIKNILKKELNYTDHHFKEMFNVDFSRENGIIKYNGKIDKDKLFNLIITFYKKGVLKTRPIKPDNYNEIAKEVIQLFSDSKIDIDEGIENKALNEIDVFSFTIDQIDNLLITSSKLSKANIEKLNFAKEIMENDIKINNVFHSEKATRVNDKENIFGYLNLQLKHNSIGVIKYTHAQAFTIRTLLEQFFIWGIYFSPNFLKILYSDLTSEDDMKNMHLKNLASENEKILNLTRDAQKILEAKNIKEILEGICTNVDINLIRFFLEFYNKKEKLRINSHLINGIIHAYHRFMGATEENKMLAEILKIQKNVLNIINNLKWDKISELNSKIQEYIKNRKE